MDLLVFPLAVLGFIFGTSAYSQIKKLKDKIKSLEERIEIIEVNEKIE